MFFFGRTSFEFGFFKELAVPFYSTASKLARFFHCCTPSLNDLGYVLFSLSPSLPLTNLCMSRSALLNAGHSISRSHACAGSFKTTASHREIHDVIRSWIQMNPVKMENMGSGSPARILLAKEPL